MSKADKYATADSSMRMKAKAPTKPAPAPAKPAVDNQQQPNGKCKNDQPDPLQEPLRCHTGHAHAPAVQLLTAPGPGGRPSGSPRAASPWAGSGPSSAFGPPAGPRGRSPG